MRYYRRKANQKVRAVLLKILFVILCAAAIFGLAVLSGNLLKRHVDAASEMLESAKPPSGNAVSRFDASDTYGQDPDSDAYSTLVVDACGINWVTRTADGLTAAPEDALVLRLQTLAEEYDTISLAVNDAEGYFYTSPMLLSLLHLPLSANEIMNDNIYKRLEILCTAVKAANLRLSVQIRASLDTLDAEAAAMLDGTVANELFAMGADEVLFTGLTSAEPDTDAINYARTYLENIREKVGYHNTIGALLPHKVFTEAAYAKQVQMSASAVDFLAIDLTGIPISNAGGNQTTLEGICQSLKGSFQVYNMRVYLGDANADLLAAQSQILDMLGLTNRQLEAEITGDMLDSALHTPQEPEEDVVPVLPEEKETAESETISHINPYVVTKTSEANSKDQTDTGMETEPETEDVSFRTDGNGWY